MSTILYKYVQILLGRKVPRSVRRELHKSLKVTRLNATISEALSRALAKVKAKGIIDVEKNRDLILNRKLLEELASGLKI
jgi:hypothetical protein